MPRGWFRGSPQALPPACLVMDSFNTHAPHQLQSSWRLEVFDGDVVSSGVDDG
ncbi:MAG: hypothetical protein JKY65_05670 [Planctomycetes bacterium]|nr:hypothetical protein [Planctomycetota bacterium]